MSTSQIGPFLCNSFSNILTSPTWSIVVWIVFSTSAQSLPIIWVLLPIVISWWDFQSWWIVITHIMNSIMIPYLLCNMEPYNLGCSTGNSKSNLTGIFQSWVYLPQQDRYQCSKNNVNINIFALNWRSLRKCFSQWDERTAQPYFYPSSKSLQTWQVSHSPNANLQPPTIFIGWASHLGWQSNMVPSSEKLRFVKSHTCDYVMQQLQQLLMCLIIVNTLQLQWLTFSWWCHAPIKLICTKM